MSTHSESPLVQKLRKLMAKANDPSVTEAEAALFAAKVQELLAANGLAMSDIADKSVDQEQVLGEKHPDSKWGSPARKQLLRAVCRYYMCEAIGPGRRGTHWTIVGKPSNVFVALEMCDYLIKTVICLSNQYGKEFPGSNKIDWRRGCMARLSERLYEELMKMSAKKAEWKGENSPSNLPALYVSEKQQIAEYIKRAIPGVSYSAAKQTKQGADAAMGRSAANSISLHRQVGGAGAGRLAIGRG